jgi:hypothetical protein
MTSYQFIQSDIVAFNFQPTLDGAVYNVVVGWSLFGQRYYVTCRTSTGTLVFSVPLIGSLDGIHIQSAEWANGYVTATCDIPHSFHFGTSVDITVTGFSPAEYNGNFRANMVDRTRFSYPLSTDPGAVASLGYVQYNINLAAGYFNSSLVYRANSQTFEVTP